MNRLRLSLMVVASGLLAGLAVVSLARDVIAQSPPAPKSDSAAAPAPAAKVAAAPALRAPTGYRRLAPGVLTTIPAPVDPDDTVSRHNIPEILDGVKDLDWKPKSMPETEVLKSKATGTVFRRPVWNLEFSFKPLRMIHIDVPVSPTQMERKRILYMVYQVRNLGGHLKPVNDGKGNWTTQRVDYPVYFFPQFILESQKYKKAYLDQVIPAAIQPIQQREDPRGHFLTTIQMSDEPIPVSTAEDDRPVWGVVTWEDVDPRIDQFTLYVKGLSSAYRWVDKPGGFKAGDKPATGRQFTQKTLQLNFWRPGDEFSQEEQTVYLGWKPGEAAEDKVDYQWIFR